MRSWTSSRTNSRVSHRVVDVVAVWDAAITRGEATGEEVAHGVVVEGEEGEVDEAIGRRSSK